MMKKIFVLFLFCFFAATAFAQKQTFDLTTFTPPNGWNKQVGKDAIQLSKEDKAKGTFCLITLYKSVPGTANSKDNFDMAWASLVKEMVTVSTAPEMQSAAIENGWETQTGHAPFESDGNKGVVILVTASSFEKMVNMIILTNTDVYEKEMTTFLESLSIKKLDLPPPRQAENPQQPPVNNNETASIIGTWTRITSDQDSYLVKNGVAGHIKRQYTFSNNGTYKHAIKTFSFFADLLLTQESGTYQVSGNNIIITPQKAVIEAWSIKNNTQDDFGSRKSSQNATMEKITYQFRFETTYSGAQLILQTSQATTKRDGHSDRENEWFYKLPTSDHDFIKFPNR